MTRPAFQPAPVHADIDQRKGWSDASLATVPADKRGNALSLGRRSRTFPRKRAPPRCATLRRMSMPERQ
tara:strand:- start:35388 stop:35594 length:207 start_codon:yes stop_codon:yes gene_type:complete